MEIAAICLTIMLIVVAIFQFLLALGLPFGEAAWGGQQGKVLPPKYRIGSGVSVIFLLFAAIVVLSKTETLDLFSETFENFFMWLLVIYFAAATVVNALSRSMREKLWAPFIAVMLILSVSILW